MKLPVISGGEAVRAYCKLGYRIDRKKGSHIILKDNGNILVIPQHRELDRGTLRAIIRQARIEKEKFLEALK